MMKTYTESEVKAIFGEAEKINADIEDPVVRAAMNYAYVTGRFGIDTVLYEGGES